MYYKREKICPSEYFQPNSSHWKSCIWLARAEPSSEMSRGYINLSDSESNPIPGDLRPEKDEITEN